MTPGWAGGGIDDLTGFCMTCGGAALCGLGVTLPSWYSEAFSPWMDCWISVSSAYGPSSWPPCCTNCPASSADICLGGERSFWTWAGAVPVTEEVRLTGGGGFGVLGLWTVVLRRVRWLAPVTGMPGGETKRGKNMEVSF